MVDTNFDLDQGSTFQKVIIYSNGDTSEVYDLTGYSAKMQLRSSAKSPDVIAELSTANGNITIDPLFGKLTLVLSATVTAAIKAGVYLYDLKITSADPVTVTTILKGSITVSAEITKDE